MKRLEKRHQAGFSLVEVMVAIVILGIALVGLTQGLTTALASGKDSQLQTTAALLAAGHIEEMRATADLKDGENEGDFGTSLPLYRWKETVKSTDVAGLHEVIVEVENAKTGRLIYELQTLLFQRPEDTDKDKAKNKKGKQSGGGGR